MVCEATGCGKKLMTKGKFPITLLEVTNNNVADAGIYCVKDKKSPGYLAKLEWFKDKINKGLKITIATDGKGKQLGFIEYIPSEISWRPIQARNYLFIQCIALFGKDAREKGTGSLLIKQCEQHAKKHHKSGICTMSSDGPWIANKTLFEKNKFTIADKLGRFELMVKSFDKKEKIPRFINWTKHQSSYRGWHLIYSDQCPWHEKSITSIKQSALDHGLRLTVKKLSTPQEAQNAPSGFGTFSLIKDGKLLADHYISKTRFETILKEESGR